MPSLSRHTTESRGRALYKGRTLMQVKIEVQVKKNSLSFYIHIYLDLNLDLHQTS